MTGMSGERQRRPGANAFMRSEPPPCFSVCCRPPRPPLTVRRRHIACASSESVFAAWQLQAHLGRPPFLLSFSQQELLSLAVHLAARAVRNSPASTIQFGRLCLQPLAPLRPLRPPPQPLKRDGGGRSSPATAAQAAGRCPSSCGLCRHGCLSPGAQYQHETAYG